MQSRSSLNYISLLLVVCCYSTNYAADKWYKQFADAAAATASAAITRVKASPHKFGAAVTGVVVGAYALYKSGIPQLLWNAKEVVEKAKKFDAHKVASATAAGEVEKRANTVLKDTADTLKSLVEKTEALEKEYAALKAQSSSAATAAATTAVAATPDHNVYGGAGEAVFEGADNDRPAATPESRIGELEEQVAGVVQLLGTLNNGLQATNKKLGTTTAEHNNMLESVQRELRSLRQGLWEVALSGLSQSKFLQRDMSLVAGARDAVITQFLSQRPSSMRAILVGGGAHTLRPQKKSNTKERRNGTLGGSTRTSLVPVLPVASTRVPPTAAAATTATAATAATGSGGNWRSE